MSASKQHEYTTLGRSGLAVSPFSLGTMTFGNDRWGSSDEEARRIFDRYIEVGGNVADCADVYADGKSEEVLGRFIADAKLRDRMVIATKFTFNPQEQSQLRRQRTQEHLSRAGGLAPTSEHGLHRSLLAASVGPEYAGRRSRRDAQHAGARRQDSLLRILQRPGVVCGQGRDAGRVP
jgi:hypothetical protein